MILNYTINSEEVAAELAAKGELLQAALLETVGSLGVQLLARVQAKIAPVVRTPIGQELFDSIQLQAAAYADAVCSTSVGIDDEGQPSYIVAYVREFGGEKWYDIYPHEQVFAMAGLSGKGRVSGNSAEDSIAAAENRLPHTLHWNEGGNSVFAMHVWHPPAKERSYLRSSLEEMQEQVRAEISGTIATVLGTEAVTT